MNKIFYDSEYDRGFPLGTFEMGDTVFIIKVKTHRFLTTPKCIFCNMTGVIEFKGRVFECPSCHGSKIHTDVDEWVVEKIGKIKSKVIMYPNNGEGKEIYFTDNFLGIVICLQRDGTCTCFTSKEEAQEKCDELNFKNNVSEQLRLCKIDGE